MVRAAMHWPQRLASAKSWERKNPRTESDGTPRGRRVEDVDAFKGKVKAYSGDDVCRIRLGREG
jgi:hypothetical protein